MVRNRPTLTAFLVLATYVLVLRPLSETGGQQFAQAVVTRIIDGDTFDVAISGRRNRVRPIGVDAPEATSKVEPYGMEATEFAGRLLSGKTVWLERDVELRDRYGRLLAYVWLQTPTSRTMAEIRSKMFNAILVAEGYAQLLTIPPNVRYVDALRILQTEARQKGKGLWAGTQPARPAPHAVQAKCDPSYPDVCTHPLLQTSTAATFRTAAFACCPPTRTSSTGTGMELDVSGDQRRIPE